MIKLKGTKNGKPMFCFGLSERNIELLKQDMPICVELEQMGGTGSVAIFYGRTESEMVKRLTELGMITDDVVVHEQKQIHEG